MSAASRRGASTSSSRASACRISKSEVSSVCEALDEHVEAFRTRPLEGRYPYLFLDAKVEKVRDGGRVVATLASRPSRCATVSESRSREPRGRPAH